MAGAVVYQYAPMHLNNTTRDNGLGEQHDCLKSGVKWGASEMARAARAIGDNSYPNWRIRPVIVAKRAVNALKTRAAGLENKPHQSLRDL